MGHLFYLVGPPASGKRTVGLQLSALTGAVLLDNHLFNDAVFKPYGADGLRPIPGEILVLAAQVRKLGLEAARLAPRDVIRIPFVSCRNRDSSGFYTPRPEPVFLLLASLGLRVLFNTL